MMETKQIFDTIDSDTLATLIDYYNDVGSYTTSTMNKAAPGKSLDLLRDMLESQLGKKLEYAQGNFYKHTQPYLPHTDYKNYQDGKINVVIPLQYFGDTPYLVIFDQTWDLDSVTWCMHYPVQHFAVNIGVKGSPYEYPVKDLSNTHIDDELYERYLSHYPKKTLFGLTGRAYEYKPGSIIFFDAKRIHCTARMSGEKLGLTLRFK